MTTELFTCSVCGESKPVNHSGGTGYGEREGRKVCYACCADLDRADMVANGKATLYLSCEPASKAFDNGRPFTPATIGKGHGRAAHGKVTNWPGTLEFSAVTRYSPHNIARWRYDVWFTGPDGFEWHGVTYGDNTQLCHCKRTKRRKVTT